MKSVEDALADVLACAEPIEPESLPVPDALGLVLAEDVTSDVDSPSHDKSTVDGYALLAADLAAGLRELKVLEELTAGELPGRDVTSGTATRVMTGVPIPAGADAVVMIEHTELVTDQVVRIENQDVVSGQNVMPRAASLARGEVVLRRGVHLRPIEVGLLCEVGHWRPIVHRRPRVGVLATGNELVPADHTPASGQIRNSNGPMLCALVQRAYGEPVNLGIAQDDMDALRQLIQRGLQQDVLVLSGGVSAGTLDLVPRVLNELGVEQVFHKVNLKPGKPLWFGQLARGRTRTLVFGLPGNPVSSLVCFELFVRPAVGRLAGLESIGLPSCRALLAEPFQQRADRPTYFPSFLEPADSDSVPSVRPLDWQGSGDLRTLVEANCLAYFPPDQRGWEAGETVSVYLI